MVKMDCIMWGPTCKPLIQAADAFSPNNPLYAQIVMQCKSVVSRVGLHKQGRHCQVALHKDPEMYFLHIQISQ